MRYDEFKSLVQQNGENRSRQGGLIPIPELWGTLRDRLPRNDFEQYVLSLDGEGLVHLLSHVEASSLTPTAKDDCVRHPSGTLLYWIRWL